MASWPGTTALAGLALFPLQNQGIVWIDGLKGASEVIGPAFILGGVRACTQTLCALADRGWQILGEDSPRSREDKVVGFRVLIEDPFFLFVEVDKGHDVREEEGAIGQARVLSPRS